MKFEVQVQVQLKSLFATQAKSIPAWSIRRPPGAAHGEAHGEAITVKRSKGSAHGEAAGEEGKEYEVEVPAAEKPVPFYSNLFPRHYAAGLEKQSPAQVEIVYSMTRPRQAKSEDRAKENYMTALRKLQKRLQETSQFVGHDECGIDYLLPAAKAEQRFLKQRLADRVEVHRCSFDPGGPGGWCVGGSVVAVGCTHIGRSVLGCIGAYFLT